MIDSKNHPVEWAILTMRLSEAREQLDSLIAELDARGSLDDPEFGIPLAHVFVHLNQAWNGRDKIGEWSDEESARFSHHPSEFLPGGIWGPGPVDESNHR